MQSNDISKIMNLERPDISRSVYSLLQHSQPTTASVETSFEMQQKLLDKTRNFNVENVKQFMNVYSILASGHCNVGCLYKACVQQVLLRICVLLLMKCLF